MSGGLSELERAAAIAGLEARVKTLEDRSAEDRENCETERERDRKRIKDVEDAIAALRRFQAWLMAGIAIIGFIAGKAVEPILDKVFK